MNEKLFEKELELKKKIDENFELKDRMELISELIELEAILEEAEKSEDQEAKDAIGEIKEEIDAREGVVESILDAIADTGEYDEDMSKWEDSTPFVMLAEIFPNIDKTKWFIRMNTK